MAYVFLLGWATIGALLAGATPALRRPLSLAIPATLVLFAGLRGDSVDYPQYQLMFDLLVELDPDYPERIFFGKDVLFGAMMDVLARLGGDVQWIFFLSALLSVGLKQIAFSRAFDGNTAAAWLATLCLTFFLHDFTQIRTAIAIALCFIALLYLLEGRKRAWLVLSVLAAGFHISTALFVPVAAVLLVRPSRRLAVWAFASAAIPLTLIVLFQLFSGVDGRVVGYGDTTGSTWTPLAVGVIRLVVLVLLARAIHGAGCCYPRVVQMVWPCVMLAATGLITLFLVRDVASALAFRVYEFFDAFAVFVVAAGLLHRAAGTRLLALAYCAFALSLQIAPGLLTPYELASFSLFKF